MDGIEVGSIVVGAVVGREVSPGTVGLNDGAMVGDVDGDPVVGVNDGTLDGTWLLGTMEGMFVASYQVQ